MPAHQGQGEACCEHAARHAQGPLGIPLEYLHACRAQGTTGVGTLSSVYVASNYGNLPPVAAALQDTFSPVQSNSEAFCNGATVDYLGNSIMVGGDNECGDGYTYNCLYRRACNSPVVFWGSKGTHTVGVAWLGVGPARSALRRMLVCNGARRLPAMTRCVGNRSGEAASRCRLQCLRQTVLRSGRMCCWLAELPAEPLPVICFG